MALPLKYNVRNVVVRWRATVATVLGIALVVAVYVLVQSMAVGLEQSSRQTGDPRNLMIVRKGSTAESSSQVTREQLRLLCYRPEIEANARGVPLVSADVLVLITEQKAGGLADAHALVRGVSTLGAELRPQVRLVEGRWFAAGRREVVVARRLAVRFEDFHLGDTFKTAGKELTVVGWFDAGGTAFDSEVWMDADEARAVFSRDHYSSILARVADEAAAVRLSAFIEANHQLPLRALRETEYYAAQTLTALPIKILGNFLATAMSIGAVFAAMNTMYASVGARTREIGTLRVLGYRRRTILASFLVEGALLALIGGGIGCLLAMPLHGYATGTVSWESFSETVFQFRITPWLAGKALLFSVVVGVVGSLLPAMRAARLPVIVALKAV